MTVEMVKELVDALERITEILADIPLDEDVQVRAIEAYAESKNLITRAKLSLRNSRNP